jgi:hypothetical protein
MREITDGVCRENLMRDARDLINSKNAEIERLRNALMGECMLSKCTREAEIASEARKEFAERFKEKAEYYSDLTFKTVDVEDIDSLLAEMESERE